MLPGRSNSLFGDIQGLNRVEEGTDGERRNAKLRRPFYVVSLLGFLFTSTYLVNPAGAPEERLGLVRGSGVGTSSAYGDVAVARSLEFIILRDQNSTSPANLKLPSRWAQRQDIGGI